jgi:uncharacterized protein
MGLLILLALGLALLWSAMVAYTKWMLTHPPRRTYASAVSRGRPGDPSELPEPRRFEEWMFKSAGGFDLPVWEVDGDDTAGPIIILTHGWADSRISALTRVSPLAAVASKLILWDLRGHGHAPGVSTLGPRERDDLNLLLDHLRSTRPRANGSEVPIVLYGWSLGAGISIEIAASAPVAAVIAEAPYRLRETPARNVLAARGLPHRATLKPALWLAAPRLAASGAYRGFDRALHAARVSCPVLVLHGSEDRVSPVDDGRAIAAAAPHGGIAEILGAGHNDLWTDPRFAQQSAVAVHEFIRSTVPRQSTPLYAAPRRDTLCP